MNPFLVLNDATISVIFLIIFLVLYKIVVWLLTREKPSKNINTPVEIVNSDRYSEKEMYDYRLKIFQIVQNLVELEKRNELEHQELVKYKSILMEEIPRFIIIEEFDNLMEKVPESIFTSEIKEHIKKEVLKNHFMFTSDDDEHFVTINGEEMPFTHKFLKGQFIGHYNYENVVDRLKFSFPEHKDKFSVASVKKAIEDSRRNRYTKRAA